MRLIVERRSIAMPWSIRTIPMSLLLAGIGYGQEAHAQVLTPPCPPNTNQLLRTARATYYRDP